MIGEKTVLAIIPARGGSKGVRRKNIREVAGKPLLAWTIETAKQSRFIDRLILSSEDDETICVAKAWNCEVPFVRPNALAQDHTPGVDPVLHALDSLPKKYDYIVLLQPTSPLRTVADIDGCIQKCIETRSPACVSVTEPDKSPFWMYSLGDNDQLISLIPQSEVVSCRQNLPKVYALNGAVYVAEVEWLTRTRTFLTVDTVAFVMAKDHSCDIDTELDLKFAELQLLSFR